MQPTHALRFPIPAPLLALCLWAGIALPAGNPEPDPVVADAYQATPDAGAALGEVAAVTLSTAQTGILCFSSAFGGVVPHDCVDEVLRVAELPRMLEGFDFNDQVP